MLLPISVKDFPVKGKVYPSARRNTFPLLLYQDMHLSFYFNSTTGIVMMKFISEGTIHYNSNLIHK